MMKKVLYCVMVGEFSKEYEVDVEIDLNKKLTNVLNKINSKYQKTIVADFSIKNNQCMGVIKDFIYSYTIATEIQKEMGNDKIMFGVSIDQLNTPISFIPFFNKGEAYNNAYAMLKKARIKKISICYHIKTGEEVVINALINLIEACEKTRTDQQENICKIYKELGSQKKVAEELKIYQSTVSEQLKKANYYEVENGKEVIYNLLSVI